MSWFDSRFHELFFQVLLNSTAAAVFLKLIVRNEKSPETRLRMSWAALLLPPAIIFSLYWFRVQPFGVDAFPQREEWPLLGRAIVALWLLGAAYFFARRLHGFHTVSRVLKRAEPIRDGELARAAAEIEREYGVRIRRSQEVTVPAVYGITRPVILVPESLALDGEEWRAILLHEAAHVMRKDALWNTLQCAIECLFFFSPAIWWISGRLRADRECATDQAVVRKTGKPLSLLQALARLAELRAAPPSFFSVGSTAGKNLIDRLERLSDYTTDFSLRNRRWLVTFVILLLLVQCSIPAVKEFAPSRTVVVIRTVIR